MRMGLLGSESTAPVSSCNVEFHVLVRDGRARTRSLVASVSEGKASESGLAVSFRRDDDAE